MEMTIYRSAKKSARCRSSRTILNSMTEHDGLSVLSIKRVMAGFLFSKPKIALSAKKTNYDNIMSAPLLLSSAT